ncbi:methyltransferase domain-containing protein [Ilumatobacter sp.]|uniref:methyltransferase domain-containing protein n=1 Tax=Ilumatobacter sp. TaxID=1967498 RepID=UPI003B52A32D
MSAPETNETTASQGTASTVGDRIDAGNARWSFGGEVAGSFETHIERSVPGYRRGHEIVAQLSDFFVSDGSLVYEIGCSTGALTRRLAEWNEAKQARFVGIEVEAEMVAAARRLAEGMPSVEILHDDALTAELQPADMIVSYYTMQFVRPARRQQLYDRIHETLEWGGAFVMFEKVRAPDARFQDMMSTLYTDHKLSEGFEASEIVAKTRSLKGVLEPFSTQGNLDMLERAGFVDHMTVFKHLCFEGFLAIK